LIVLYRSEDLRDLLDARRREGANIGFVPTMGFLHEGHLSLVRASIAETERTVVSIFVNPTQFAEGEDLDSYPRDLRRDTELLEGAGVHYLFAPDVDELYPDGAGRTTVDPGRIAEVGEGKYRPGHFTGVATVCTKLFSIVGPCRAYFGQKDAQQVAVVRQVVGDLDLDVEVVACPTLREPSGLAMSSRNSSLDDEVKKAAAVIYEGLEVAAKKAREGQSDPSALIAAVEQAVSARPELKVQYVEVVDPQSFEPVERVTERALITTAVLAGRTRLIDNLELNAAPS